jgi:hypothetical protein
MSLQTIVGNCMHVLVVVVLQGVMNHSVYDVCEIMVYMQKRACIFKGIKLGYGVFYSLDHVVLYPKSVDNWK